MPLEDEIIPDSKQGPNQSGGLQNFLDSAQNVLADVVAKNAAEKVVDGMFSPGKHGNRVPSDGPPQEGIYPDLDRGGNQNREPSFMDNAQNAFADAFAKRAAEKLVDGILPSDNTKQPEGNNYGHPSQGPRAQESDNSGFDLGNLGSSLLDSFAGQILHPSDKQNPQHSQQQPQDKFDLGSVGSELLSSLADQVLHPNKISPNQHQTSAPQSQVQSENQSGFDLGKVGSEILGSLAEQVLHPSDKKVAEQPHSQPPANEDSQSVFSKVGTELLGSLAEQVLHSSDKKGNVPIQPQPIGYQGNPNPNQTGGGDIGSILGSLAENVLGGVRHNPENQKPDSSKEHHTFADSAGEMASSLLGSLTESMLHKNSNNDQQQYQGPNNYGPFPQGPPPPWYGPGPEGPQAYGPGLQSYGPGPQDYGPGPQGYGPGPQGYGPGPQGYRPGPQGYGPPPQAQTYWPDSQRSNSGQPNPAFVQDHRHQRKQPEEDESPAAELGSFLFNSLATKVLQPHHQQ